MAANSCSIDANALLDWLLNRDKVRTGKVEAIIDKGDVNVADITVMELAYVLEKIYQQPRNLVSDNLTRIIEDDKFKCNRNLFRKVIPLYQARVSLSFGDCCAVFYAQLNNSVPLYTFDKKLASQVPELTRLI